MTDLNKKKLSEIKEKLGMKDKDGSEYLIKPREATAETSRPFTLTEYVKLVRDELSHFPTHIQIRILARAAMQVADEQKRAIDGLAKGFPR